MFESVPQASDGAKEAEDNARKAKSTVKTVLKLISTLMEQLGEFSPDPASSGAATPEATPTDCCASLQETWTRWT